VKAVRIDVDGVIRKSAMQVRQDGMEQGEIADIAFKVGADYRY
jgi:hypothetical protein